MARRIDTCSCCGGDLPAPHGSDALDDLDDYLRRSDGACPGHLTVSRTGQVLGCGAWMAGAYMERDDGDAVYVEADDA